MKKIDIRITKAAIHSFSITLHEDDNKIPDVSATVNCYASNNKKITDYSVSTQTWTDNPFELPPGMIAPILKIAEELENIVIQKANAELKLLSNKTEETNA